MTKCKSKYTRYSCGMEAETNCTHCGTPLCNSHVRVPDPEEFPDRCEEDYCLECSAKLGFLEIWDCTYYLSQHGDRRKMFLDAPVGTHPFEIPRALVKLDPLLHSVFDVGPYRKIKMEVDFE